ncbi:MAG: hypothetical protein IJ131_09415 [Eggerthellaceae bacterium]|nr:hypothetical protein [Eggerthellaceae bacterium]
MERSGSQKVLLVVSIINIILSIFVIIGGISVNLAGGLLGAAAESPEVAAEIAVETGGAVTGGQLGFLAIAGGLAFIIVGVIELLMGILGVRAANDNQKIMPVWILSIISLVLGIIGFIAAIINGSMPNFASVFSNILSIAGSALMFWIANNIKVQAGK